ncbi:MAG: hypothetical protein A2107_07785 [Verrucomicrobia bacterium GWF2_62_7]|nr:MAG: hypothetical protein A2107_07785 [Verrucomicrobia bacterium GWF2_62_7]
MSWFQKHLLEGGDLVGFVGKHALFGAAAATAFLVADLLGAVAGGFRIFDFGFWLGGGLCATTSSNFKRWMRTRWSRRSFLSGAICFCNSARRASRCFWNFGLWRCCQQRGGGPDTAVIDSERLSQKTK